MAQPGTTGGIIFTGGSGSGGAAVAIGDGRRIAVGEHPGHPLAGRRSVGGIGAAAGIAFLVTDGFCGWPKSSGPVSTTGTGVAEEDVPHSTAGSGVTTAETAAAGGSGSELGESA